MEVDPNFIKPIRADQRTLTSLLRRAIQRSDVVLSQRAALTILRLKGPGIWRRLLTIAFEDVGAGSPDVLCEVTKVCCDKDHRKRIGLAASAINTAKDLAEAPKERSVGSLLSAACGEHPALEKARLASQSPSFDLRQALSDPSWSLPERAVLAARASGIEWGQDLSRASGRVRLAVLMEAYRSLGAPEWLLAATLMAADLTKRPAVPLVPLVWLAIQSAGSARVTRPYHKKETATVADGVPMYAVDTNTRLGREAIRRFSVERPAITECLFKHAPPFARRHAAYLAAYHADIFIQKRFLWPGAEAISRLGLESDFLRIGVPIQEMDALLDVFRADVNELHQIRAQLFHANNQH